jgi:hypothetical protein
MSAKCAQAIDKMELLRSSLKKYQRAAREKRVKCVRNLQHGTLTDRLDEATRNLEQNFPMLGGRKNGKVDHDWWLEITKTSDQT